MQTDWTSDTVNTGPPSKAHCANQTLNHIENMDPPGPLVNFSAALLISPRPNDMTLSGRITFVTFIMNKKQKQIQLTTS
jgi:hypothetical protein